MRRGKRSRPEGPVQGNSEDHIRIPSILRLTFRLQFLKLTEAVRMGSLHVVTVRILNILAEPVAVPTLLDASSSSTTGSTGSLGGSFLTNLKLACGEYVAYWDGNMTNGKEAASGIYLVQFYVDGKFADSKRIYNKK